MSEKEKGERVRGGEWERGGGGGGRKREIINNLERCVNVLSGCDITTTTIKTTLAQQLNNVLAYD